jgi:hypothetical protein
LVVTGARCPLTQPVVAAVELQATTEPHCSRGVQPGGIYVYVGTARAGSRRSGAGLAPRPQALPMPATALISTARSNGTIETLSDTTVSAGAHLLQNRLDDL